jgi:preprotein translocase subunit SecA
MLLQERRLALQKVDPALFGIYEAEVRHFLQHFEDMERVRELGGLHVVGSERHEARRIDNQLRGRAARQGDPGSSRFYLSLEDDLMRMFGGDQVKNIMARLNIDDDFPLQARMVSNMIEQSQTRVEGANFDVRKHLIEYDDVLNSQRMRIYGQRNRVFEKDDLGEDVDELLRAEIEHRVGEAAASEEYWRLLAWLDQIQPPVLVGGKIFPSYTYKLLLGELSAESSDLRSAALDLAGRTLEAGQDHFLAWALDQIDHAGDAIKTQIDERVEALDTFLDALNDRDETDTRRPQELVEELVNTVRVQLRLSNEQSVLLSEDPKTLYAPLRKQVEAAVTGISITHLAATIEFRFGELLGFNPSELQTLDWKEAANRIEDRLRLALEERRERLLGTDGQIVRDLQALLERFPEGDDQARIRLLTGMSQGSRTSFDARTHRQVRQVFLRLQYGYYAGELLRLGSGESLAGDILEHLNQARTALGSAFQESEAARLGLAADSPQLVETGKRIQNQIYRQVLLGGITELWVDYLTRVEALRVSVGLEAYAQRDPLVQYKGRASEMFQTLLTDIRAAVISRIFLYRPRAAMVAPEPETAVNETSAEAQAEGQQAQVTRSEKKRKRHRH